MSVRVPTLALLAATLVVVAGCGGESRVPVSPVKGTVTRDGKPLARVSVRFHPTGASATPAQPGDDSGNAAKVAEADDQGQFTLSTYEPGDGVPPGDYAVTILPPSGPESEQRDGPAPQVRVDPTLAKYGKVATSPLKVTVQPGDNPDLKFEIK